MDRQREVRDVGQIKTNSIAGSGTCREASNLQRVRLEIEVEMPIWGTNVMCPLNGSMEFI